MHFQGQKVKGQGHQAALLIAALTRPAAAAVSVGTYGREKLLRCGTLGGSIGPSAPTEGGGVGAVTPARLQLVYLSLKWCNLKRFTNALRKRKQLGKKSSNGVQKVVVPAQFKHRGVYLASN